ncbi:TetR/AcrR family transcriptional regulator [Allonocardiopsis opalescens]|uniref:TetR family transcriptional regulator n=1 Tax=Allonocardiopsis opalescens TaxID=1144618 RepID=A0A2T0PY12_9ACTN|nr:TetR/AcrR family transcriptional regulator [Allonocardiopsis opalescens]PRX96348.1 TetR family transcriptional regulator [Allonocardiopsis opalescens]
MPARGDHDARRRDVSAAVWRVLAARGFGGLTLRAVAAEMGASTGLLTHYFPSKRELLRHALDVADEHTSARERTAPRGPGLAALRAALLDVLPLTAEATAMNRVWVSSWDAALSDPELGGRETERYARWRTGLRAHVEAAQRLGELPADADPGDLTLVAASFAHGLVVQALFAPGHIPAERQLRLLDRFLAGLAAGGAAPAGG